ncbi:hypothetical protein D3C85_726590 [compost metagenome]
MAGETQGQGQLFECFLVQFRAIERRRQQQAQLQSAAVLVTLQGDVHGLTQAFDGAFVTLGYAQALTRYERRVDIVGTQHHVGLFPVAQLFGCTHGVVSGFQTVFQGRDTCPLQPGGAENARRAGHLAELVEIGQIAHPCRTITLEVGNASLQHVGGDQGIRRGMFPGVRQQNVETLLRLFQCVGFIKHDTMDGLQHRKTHWRCTGKRLATALHCGGYTG